MIVCENKQNYRQCVSALSGGHLQVGMGDKPSVYTKCVLEFLRKG